MASLLPEKPEIQVKRKDPNVGVARGAHRALVISGAVVLVLWLVVLGLNWRVGSETTETTKPAVTGATGATGATGSTGATSESTKTTKTKELASETLLASLLGTGAALILVGFLYARISSIKLPGGVEILTEKEKESTADGVTQGLPDDATPEQAVTATQEAESAVRTVKAVTTGELSPAAVKEIAMRVASETS